MKKIKFKKNHEVRKGIIFLVFVLLCSLNLSAQTEFVIGNLKYTTTTDSTVSVGKNGTPTGDLVIPASVEYKGTQYSVTSIGPSAFRECTSLTSVTIPNSVTSIGKLAFYNCTGLTSIDIPNSVTSVGDYAFAGCTGLSTVTIPNSVTSIGESAFTNCEKLTSIDIPNSVTSIGDYAFSACTGLTVINVDENNTNYSSIDGVLLNKSQTELILCPEGKQGAYTIPNSVTSIGDRAFYNCTGLTSIDIPNSVTSIGNYAFQACTGLTSIDIPNSVTSVGGIAFIRCSGLTAINVDENNTVYSSINGVLFNKSQTELVRYPEGKQGAYTIPNSVSSIGDRAFETCKGLISIDIPNSVTSIGKFAFIYCTGLSSVTIPNSVTSIGAQTFYFCRGLTSIDIPNLVTSIGDGAFNNCTGLTSVTIPNSVTSIGDNAFGYCTSLTSVTIPNSVTSIGNYAFVRCTGLTDIYCHIEEPLTIRSSVFEYVPKNSCTLHVPIGSKEKYKVAYNWKDFLNIVEDLPTGIISIDNSQLTIDNDVWHTLNGVRLNGKPTKAGVYIVNGKTVVVK